VDSLTLPVRESAADISVTLYEEEQISLTSIGEGLGSRIGSAAQGVLGRVQVTGAFILSTVGVGSGGVTEFLGGGLLAI
jgi:hypothetical protein